MPEEGYHLEVFTEMAGGTLIKRGKDEPIRHILTDSRLHQAREGIVFFAIKTRRNDGHRYVKDLLERGVRHFVISDEAVAHHLEGANVILVSDTRVALQKLAGAHRARFQGPVLAITGSNGKTVVKEWLFQLLHRHRRVLRSPRSYNSQIGVPLSLWLLRPTHDMAIIEAGISQPGEMPHLAKMIQPQVGIFTNIGQAHQEHFAHIDQKINEKLHLFSGAETVIYCKDQREVHEALHARFDHTRTSLLSWSIQGDQSAHFCIHIAPTPEGTLLSGTYAGRKRKVNLAFTDSASVENACHCWLYLLHEGFSDRDIASGFAQLTPIAMRLEQLDGVLGSTVINDAYNSDFTSLEIALGQLGIQRKNSHHTAIVSDLVQTGEPPEQMYRRMADLIRSNGIHTFIGVGPGLCAHQHFFEGLETKFYSDTDDFLRNFHHRDFAQQNILVKGARRFAFERIAAILSEKTHETILEIDLSRIHENLNYLRSLLHPEVQVMVMVKAFAYGSGAYEVARTLEFYGVEYLAVAYADEGITLREAGIQMPIMVLNPELSTYDAMIRYKLEPQIFSFRTLRKFVDTLFAADSDWPYPIHLKINTGMNRLGFDLEEVEELGTFLASNEAVRVVSVFSHLAGSESTEFDALTHRQATRFEQAIQALQKQLTYDFKRHLLNSQGVFRHPQYQMDMVRIGLALYGISGNDTFRKHLKPVGRLVTSISQLRRVPPGEGVGYSPKQVLTEETEVAVIPIGYADGLPRALGNGVGHVLIRGHRRPFLGNICMDMAMVDVTGAGCREGDQVEVFGDRMDVYEMAENLGTIPYEVLTSVSQRVKRVYLHG